MLAVVGLVSSVQSQEIGCEDRLRNDHVLCRVGRKTLMQHGYEKP